jgi:phage terminase Nu1 subunit (DNA packaging protein)
LVVVVGVVVIARKRKSLPRTKDELAKLLGVSTEMVRRYEHKGMPVEGPPYDPEPCREWIALHIEKRKIDPDQKEADVKLRRRRDLWQLRGLREAALAKRLARQERRKELVELTAVRQWIIKKFLRIKQRLELLPNELQMLAPGEVRPVFRSDLQKAIKNLLLEMSSWKYD